MTQIRGFNRTSCGLVQKRQSMRNQRDLTRWDIGRSRFIFPACWRQTMTVPYTSSSSLLRHPSRLLASRSTTVCLFCCIQRRWQHYTDPDADPDLDGRVERAKNLRTPESLHQRYKDGELVPKPLKRAIGMPDPPRPGENSGRDQRTWRQKRDDFASYERHKERRRQLYICLIPFAAVYTCGI